VELEGHPTQDLVEELQRRGGLAYPGSDSGPEPESLELPRRRKDRKAGVWLFLPAEAYDTGLDDEPPVTQ
jgi:hypothetical protein